MLHYIKWEVKSRVNAQGNFKKSSLDRSFFHSQGMSTFVLPDLHQNEMALVWYWQLPYVYAVYAFVLYLSFCPQNQSSHMFCQTGRCIFYFSALVVFSVLGCIELLALGSFQSVQYFVTELLVSCANKVFLLIKKKTHSTMQIPSATNKHILLEFTTP